MADINYAFICGAAEQQASALWDFRLVGIRSLNLPRLPGFIQLIVVAHVTWSDSDLGHENTVSVLAEDPLEQERARTSTIVVPVRQSTAHFEDAVITMVVQPLVFDVEYTGRYLLKVEVESSAYALPLRIRGAV